MNKFNELYESIMNEGEFNFPSNRDITKIYDRASQYKPAKLKIDGKIYVLMFNRKAGLFEVFDNDGNDITMELDLGAGLNTRKLATAKKDLKDWLS